MYNECVKIDKSKSFFEIESFGCTLDVAQTFTQIKKVFTEIISGKDFNQQKAVKVWIIQSGFKFPVPKSALI